MLYLCSRFQKNRLRNQAAPQQKTKFLHSACTGFVTLRRDGRVVDYNGLENRRAERHRGFESLSLRFFDLKGINQGSLFSCLIASTF